MAYPAAMGAFFDTAYDDGAPVHRLGQYTAWRLRCGRRAPADLVWISLADRTSPAAHRVLPHGEPSIAIRRRRDRKGDVSAVDLTVCGPFQEPRWYHPEPAEELIAIRLKPEIAARIFGVAPGEHFDAPPSLAPQTLADACAASLRLAETGDRHAVARALAGDLHAYAASRATDETPETIAAEILRHMDGRATCADLARRLEISERHLRRRFRDRLGCSPKRYARQLRLTAAALAAEKEARPRWAEIAADAGFHDQAHMINEFQAMLAMTPQQLHAERRVLSGFCNTSTAQ